MLRRIYLSFNVSISVCQSHFVLKNTRDRMRPHFDLLCFFTCKILIDRFGKEGEPATEMFAVNG